MTPERLQLDYVDIPRYPRWPGVVVLLVGLAVAVALLEQSRDARLELERIESARGLVAERGAPRQLPRERLEEEIKSTEATVRQLALPWGPIIEAVETASNPEIAILQMQPDAQQRLLRLTAEARTREAMFDYLRRLSATPALAEVHVASHQVQSDDPQRPIQFTAQAVLREAR